MFLNAIHWDCIEKQKEDGALPPWFSYQKTIIYWVILHTWGYAKAGRTFSKKVVALAGLRPTPKALMIWQCFLRWCLHTAAVGFCLFHLFHFSLFHLQFILPEYQSVKCPLPFLADYIFSMQTLKEGPESWVNWN